MKKILTIALCSSLSLAGAASAQENVSLGVLLGFTGPIESLSPAMADGADLAVQEINKYAATSGYLFNTVRADSTCIDAAAATAAATRLITSDKVAAIVGADCSGVTTAVLNNVAIPRGIVMISPSATTPALSDAKDNGLFFRTAPSDARQGQVLAEIMIDKGVQSAAVSYTKNDYGKGLADSLESNFKQLGGQITISASHEDGKGDYNAEIGALAAAGGDVLVVLGYLDQGGRGIIEASLDTGAFDTFVLGDGMIGESLPNAIGSDLDGSYGTRPGSGGAGAELYANVVKNAGYKTGPYTAESYDAAALLTLAIISAQSTSSDDIKDRIITLANGPGEKIYAGELGRAVKLLTQNIPIDYEGGTAVRLIGGGESSGSYAQIEVSNGVNTTVGFK